jgi:hypothetical protein
MNYRCGNAAELIKLVEEALYLVSVAVQEGAEDKGTLAVALGRDVGPDVLFLSLLANGISIVSLVGQQDRARPQAGKQLLGNSAVMNLTECHSNPD